MRNLIILFLFSVATTDALSATYFIDRNRDIIDDHSDPEQYKSIAWYFKEKGPNNKFILTSPSTSSYGIKGALELPAGSTLGANNGKAWIKVVRKIKTKIPKKTENEKQRYKTWMLGVNNGSEVKDIIFDGNYLAENIIRGTNVNGFWLYSSVIRRTMNIYDTDPAILGNGRIEAHGVLLSNSKNVLIRDNDIQNIGDNGTNVSNNSAPSNVVATRTKGIIATGLSLRRGENLLVSGNRIKYTLSAGIDLTDSVDATITENTIDNVGRNNLYGLPFAADGIVGYHHKAPDLNRQFVITNNTITNWYNHGIHLAGRWINIAHNRIYSPGASTPGSAIFIGDWRTRQICSTIVWIQHNYVKRSSNSYSKGIRARNYNHAAYWPYRNTGDVGSSVKVVDHRYENLEPIRLGKYPGLSFDQKSCPYGLADQHYIKG